MIIRRILALALCVFPAAVMVSGQEIPAGTEDAPIVVVAPILSADGVPAGGTIKLAVKARIIPGWHINGPVQDDPFIIPSVLSCEEMEGLTVVETFYPEARIARFGYSDGEIAFYDGDIVLGFLMQAAENAPAGPVTIKGRLSYQACDDESCLPPKSEPFEIEVVVVAAGTATTELHSEIFAGIEFKKK
ncbi:MAG: protein-disulfide reductase DsbD family protein [Acidobacteriota bacterium]|nr:protein-disulfide reductase DsbD family protein [Acidobacteriota bacterium]